LHGRLSQDAVKVLRKTSAVSVVMASAGYPGKYASGHTISGLERSRRGGLPCGYKSDDH